MAAAAAALELLLLRLTEDDALEEQGVTDLTAQGQELIAEHEAKAAASPEARAQCAQAGAALRRRLRSVAQGATAAARGRRAAQERAVLLSGGAGKVSTMRRRHNAQRGVGDEDSCGGSGGAQRITKALSRTVSRAQESIEIVERSKETLANDDESLLRIGSEHRTYKETVETSGSYLSRLQRAANLDVLVHVVGIALFAACSLYVVYQRVRFRIPLVGWLIGLG